MAPELFTMDEFGYAAAAGDGTVPEDRTHAARRACEECPAGAVRRFGCPVATRSAPGGPSARVDEVLG